MNNNTKTALVTGASRGIGKAITEKLASLGINVIIHYVTNEIGALETQAICQKFAVKTSILQCDFTDTNQFANFIGKVKFTLSEWNEGKIDILVNNAAIFTPMKLHDFTFEDFDQTIDANLKYPVFLTKELLPAFNENGRIINVTSYSAAMPNRPYVTNPVYAMTKAGLSHFTVTLAAMLSHRKITANGIIPVFVNTDMIKNNQAGPINLPQSLPMSEPADVANILEFLVSDAGSYITGQFLACSEFPV